MGDGQVRGDFETIAYTVILRLREIANGKAKA
jgi:hypothetical protein